MITLLAADRNDAMQGLDFWAERLLFANVSYLTACRVTLECNSDRARRRAQAKEDIAWKRLSMAMQEFNFAIADAHEVGLGDHATEHGRKTGSAIQELWRRLDPEPTV